MLREFRQSYPTGSLISDLLTIHEGKYLVRVIVRVDGESLATGLAAADKLELAEDRARERAMEALGISPARVLTAKTMPQKPAAISPDTEEVYMPRPTSSQPESNFPISQGNQASTATPPITEMEPASLTPPTDISRSATASSQDWSSERSAMPSWQATDSFSASSSA